MQNSRRFIQCDVFSAIPTKGNALAVVVDGGGLSDAEMQNFARWTNLAETTFLMAPDDPQADYKVRIFTPFREMPFAGHPTLGSCMSWLRVGGEPKFSGVVRQECGVGLVEIAIGGNCPAFVAPPTAIAGMDRATRARIIERLGLAEDQVRATIRLENGPVWQVFELTSAEDVLPVDSGLVKWPEFKAIGLIGRQPDGADSDYEVRMLAPSSGMSEDPITGSLNSAIACWLQGEGRLERDIVIAQGTKIGCAGRVFVGRDASGRITIGGDVRFVVEGNVLL